MVSILGYYTSNACVTGSPLVNYPGITRIFLEKEICEEGKESERENVYIISPPFDPSQIELLEVAAVNPEVQAKLIESGHYWMDEEGVLRSRFLSELRPYPGEESTFVSPLIAGGIEDIRPGNHPVYPYRECKGLAENVRIEEPGFPPVYVVDNHHLALFAWEEALDMGYIEKGAVLIHVDKHSDFFSSLEGHWFSGTNDLQGMADFVVKELTVGNFIQPAISNGTIRQFWFFEIVPYLGESLRKDKKGRLLKATDKFSLGMEEDRIESLLEKQKGPQNVILDIDLDAFVLQEEDYLPNTIPSDEKFKELARFLGRIARKAGVVTIATSPYFANQEVAIPLARQIVREMYNVTAGSGVCPPR